MTHSDMHLLKCNSSPTMSLSNVVDQLHNEHSLSDSGTSEQTNLATTLVWGQKINDLQIQKCMGQKGGTNQHMGFQSTRSGILSHLNSSNQNLLLRALLNEGRGLAVNGPGLCGFYS
jgi:hypothetical protein